MLNRFISTVDSYQDYRSKIKEIYIPFRSVANHINSEILCITYFSFFDKHEFI